MSEFLSWLLSRDEADLAEILRQRPEVLSGSAPADLAAVESRLSQHHSIGSALLRQPRPALQALTALLLLGGVASVERCAWALEGNHEHVRHWLVHLENAALAWVDADDVARVAPLVAAVFAVPEAWGTPARLLLDAYPKDSLTPTLSAWGLPRQSTKAATIAVLLAAFGDPERLATQLERLTPAQRRLLADAEDLHTRPARLNDHRWLTERSEAHRAALDAGLLLSPYAYSPFSGDLPTEVRLALSDQRLPFDPVTPVLPTSDVSAPMAAQEARAALEQFNEASLSVLDHVRGQPVKTLQSGGIGAREVTRMAKAVKIDAETVRLVLDAAGRAGLLERRGVQLCWGEVASAWRDLEAGPRVALLLEQWLDTPRSPTQTRDTTGKALAVGDNTRTCPLCRDGRLTILGEWSRIEGATTDEALAAYIAWIRPLTHTAHRELVREEDNWDYGGRGRRRPPATALPPPLALTDEVVDLGTNADEARRLGLVARGASTPLLQALLARDHATVVALAGELLPAATGTATFGSDLTAVVVGPPTGELSALLDSCADRESRGGAVTWRFSTASVRRALDAGATAAGLDERLTRVATGGLPQPLAYLLADVGRRHGRLRVAPAMAVVRSEDEALLAEAVVDRKLRRLALRLVAPTVAVSAAGEAETIAALRAAGYLPMPEQPASTGDEPASATGAPDDLGNVIDLSRHRRTAPGPGGGRGVEAPAPEGADKAAARLVGVARAPGIVDLDPRLEAALRQANRILSDDEITILAEAILMDRGVRIRYRAANSSVTERVVSDLEFSGQHLGAWCHLRNDERVFRVSEVLSVAYP